MDKEALNKLKKGKSKEQQQVLDYFLLEGCMVKIMKDDEYLSLVMSKRDSLKLREKALSKIGIDEDELKEISPASLEGFVFYNAWAKQQAGGRWVSSSYQVAWIFCSATQVYIYRCTFCLDEDKKSESTDEFFYKDVTSVSTSSEHEIIKNKSDSGADIEVESHKFVMVVPGDKLRVSLDGVPNAEEIIQAMKQKMRDKKMG
jgi:hypothetical protein